VEEAVRDAYRRWLNQTATDFSMAGKKTTEAFLALVAAAISSA
jgi:hypothetical protein